MRVHMRIFLTLLNFIWLTNMNPLLLAQNASATPNNCEDALLHLDVTALEARKEREGYIIVIARLGDGEKSQRLSQRRLKAATDYLRSKARNKVVAAHGERLKGFGRLELYVGGRLLYSLAYPRNGIIDCRGLG